MAQSEKLFERLCATRHIRFEPIVVGSERSADYRVWLGDVETIVEVKQIEYSEHEKNLLASAENEDAPAIASDMVSRIRNKFDKAKGQLKNLSRGQIPTLLVIYDNTHGLSRVDEEDFLQALHGSEVVEISHDGRGKILKAFHTFGKKQRKVGRSYNQSVTAVGWLQIDNNGNPSLVVFHNEFATNRLTKELVNLISEKQYRRRDSENNEYRIWEKV